MLFEGFICWTLHQSETKKVRLSPKNINYKACQKSPDECVARKYSSELIKAKKNLIYFISSLGCHLNNSALCIIEPYLAAFVTVRGETKLSATED